MMPSLVSIIATRPAHLLAPFQARNVANKKQAPRRSRVLPSGASAQVLQRPCSQRIPKVGNTVQAYIRALPQHKLVGVNTVYQQMFRGSGKSYKVLRRLGGRVAGQDGVEHAYYVMH